MEVCFGKPADIDRWMDLVRRVRGNFPGLETEKDLEEHRQTKRKTSNTIRKDAALRSGLWRWMGVFRWPGSFWKDKDLL